MGQVNDTPLEDDANADTRAAVVEKPVLQPVIPLTRAADDDRLEGAPMPWNTGIAEVELPMAFKWKNIEVCGLSLLSLYPCSLSLSYRAVACAARSNVGAVFAPVCGDVSHCYLLSLIRYCRTRRCP